MNPRQLLTQYLDQKHAVQLATEDGDKPWICTVYFVADENFNLYWASLPSRRHSQQIKNNPRVAAAIVVKAVIGEAVIGIQMQGAAEELEPKDYSPDIVKKYAAKFKRDGQWEKDFFGGKTEHRLYKLTPSSVFLFDEENFPGGQRQPVELA